METVEALWGSLSPRAHRDSTAAHLLSWPGLLLSPVPSHHHRSSETIHTATSDLHGDTGSGCSWCSSSPASQQLPPRQPLPLEAPDAALLGLPLPGCSPPASFSAQRAAQPLQPGRRGLGSVPPTLPNLSPQPTCSGQPPRPCPPHTCCAHSRAARAYTLASRFSSLPCTAGAPTPLPPCSSAKRPSSPCRPWDTFSPLLTCWSLYCSFLESLPWPPHSHYLPHSSQHNTLMTSQDFSHLAYSVCRWFGFSHPCSRHRATS